MIEEHLTDKRISIITGARQVGKTSILRLLYQKLKSEDQQVFYLSFEDITILASINHHPDRIFDHLRLIPKPILEGLAQERIYLLIDEVQYAKDPTQVLKFLYDKYETNLKIVATGSSAFYIDRKFKDSLAGRKRIFHLFPLSFKEFLIFKKVEDLAVELDVLRERKDYFSPKWNDLKVLLYEYLEFGGYPAVVLESDLMGKKLQLEELKNAYIKRDMLESGVEKGEKFYLMIQLLADQSGGMLNKHELANTLKLDAKTVDYYIYVLEKCFHVFLLKPFFRNFRKELTKMPKVYFNDLGLRNAFVNRYGDVSNRSDRGQLLENFIYCHLIRKYSIEQIRFWRTSENYEVDFIVEESFGKGFALEIKWNNQKPHKKGFQKFIEAYPEFPIYQSGIEDFFKFV